MKGLAVDFAKRRDDSQKSLSVSIYGKEEVRVLFIFLLKRNSAEVNAPVSFPCDFIHICKYSSALESTPSVGSSPSLYEGAFRLETSTGRPSQLFSGIHATMLIGPTKAEHSQVQQGFSVQGCIVS